MLRQLNYQPYHSPLIHALSDGDQDKRVEFCEQSLQMVDNGEMDIDRTLGTIRRFLNSTNGSIVMTVSTGLLKTRRSHLMPTQTSQTFVLSARF